MASTASPRPIAELTLRGILLGGIITLLFTAANVYLGLKVGLTFATSIPAAVISMAILRMFRDSSILENNIVQTIASAAGTLAAIDAAPGADVVFVAHTGADDLLSPADIWRRTPMDRPLRARWWRVPYAQIPPENRERWMYEWWGRIDAWIAANREPQHEPAP